MQRASRHLIEQHPVGAGGDAGPRRGGWWAEPPTPGQVQMLGWALAPGGGKAAPALQSEARWSERKGLGSGLSGRKGPQGSGAEMTAQTSPTSRLLPGQPHLLLGLRVRQRVSAPSSGHLCWGMWPSSLALEAGDRSCLLGECPACGDASQGSAGCALPWKASPSVWPWPSAGHRWSLRPQLHLRDQDL